VCNYDAATQEFVYTNAGHLPLLIKRRDGSLVVLDDHQGTPICIGRDCEWETLFFSVASSDTLLMLADGVTEARSESRQEFGVNTIQRLLSDHDYPDPQACIRKFTETFTAHLGGRRRMTRP
jgi:sigma-B regulation protein RsbU (phosphoserine phosphatase)